MRTLLALVSTVLAVSLVTACDSSTGGSSGGSSAKRCSVVGSHACINDVAHGCRYNDGNPIWEPYEDCTQSTTDGCHCTMPAGGGFAYCSTNGETSGACEGQ